VSSQPKQKHSEKVAARTAKIVKVAEEIGFFPENELHPAALHSSIENSDLYEPFTLHSGKAVERFSAKSSTVQATLVIIRSGSTKQITRAILVPDYGSVLTRDQLEESNLKLAEILAD